MIGNLKEKQEQLYMNQQYKSPNYDDRSDGRVKYLIMHYTGMETGKAALDRLCDEEAKVSAHYMIEENGEVYHLVDESKRAWHAGVSKWENDIGLNDLSIGIELVNTGHPYPGYDSVYRPFPERQMAALIELSKSIVTRQNIKPCYVIGHSDIAWRRKIDPGELFDWYRLAAEGIGVWPDNSINVELDGINTADFLEKLKLYGYDIEGCIEDPVMIVSAFQRHFRPRNFDGQLDRETVCILERLLLQKFN